MKKIIGTGLSGLVGSRIVELLKDELSFEDISRKTGTDILDGKGILERIQNSDTDTVIHMAAYTHVDEAEQEKELGANSQSWKINVIGTENVVAACKATGKRLIYISTDFVFDGENTPAKGYSEEDTPHPINWYAMTKHEGEKRVSQSNIPWAIVRIAYPYRADFEKNDFFRAMKQRLIEGKHIAGVTDHIFCPTFIDDIAHALGILCKTNTTGIYHATGSEALSPNEAAHAIAEVFGLDTSLITATTREEYFKGKAQRPFDLSMNNGKIKLLGVQMRGFREGLQEIKKQI
jgi:dTDP-4-dehydrorhamnose reductase